MKKPRRCWDSPKNLALHLRLRVMKARSFRAGNWLLGRTSVWSKASFRRCWLSKRKRIRISANSLKRWLQIRGFNQRKWMCSGLKTKWKLSRQSSSLSCRMTWRKNQNILQNQAQAFKARNSTSKTVSQMPRSYHVLQARTISRTYKFRRRWSNRCEELILLLI